MSGSRVFEVVLGGWGNSMSVIRRAQQGDAIASVQGAVLSNSQFRGFVLAWDTPKVLKLYSKADSGSLTLLMQTAQQGDGALDIQTMRVATGWGSTGQWSVLV